MKISVIVRVCDTEYINRCIDSLLCQSFDRQEFEIILAGEGDRVKTVCEKYLSEGNIKYIHTDPADFARIAKLSRQVDGEYLRFVKSEDALSPFYLSTLYRICEDLNIKMASCGLQRVSPGIPVENIPALLMLWPEMAVEKEEFLSDLQGGNEAYRFLYNKLFCKKLLAVVCELTNADDKDFIAAVVSACERVGVTGQPLYFLSVSDNLPQ